MGQIDTGNLPPIPEGHVHRWEAVAHVDCCHYFIWQYACTCGYVRETSQERDPSDYGEVWMRDDDGSPMCERCAALLDGAERLPPLEITKPGGAFELRRRESA